MRRVVVVGDALLDRDVDGDVSRLSPDAPVPVLDEASARTRPGGAALAAALVAADGRPVTLVSALGDDGAGRHLRRLLDDCGVELIDLGLHGPTPEKIRFVTGGRPLLRLDRGGRPSPPGPLVDRARRALTNSPAILVADYGRGVTGDAALRAVLGTDAPVRRAVVWDPHPRGSPPVPGTMVVTPNEAELAAMTPPPARPDGGRAMGGTPATGAGTGAGTASPAELSVTVAHARRARVGWRAQAVAVTLGARGALLVDGEAPPLVVPTAPVHGADTCGAGDRFSSAMASTLADGALTSEAVVAAVRAAADYVAAGGGGAFTADRADRPAIGRPGTDPFAVADTHRRQGGTVVATGGCFDLLHAGHVAMLQAARSLGSCLVVCLNSDRSVRRLKGPGRPVVPHGDRAAVLLALDCVDAVAVFDEDTPDAVLDRLRPHLFAKGGDYAGTHLPEAVTMARWGGQAVVLPYLSGRSTTGLLARAPGGPA